MVCATFCNSNLREEVGQERKVSIVPALESEKEVVLSKPIIRQDTSPAINQSVSDPSHTAEIKNSMQEVEQEACPSMLKVAEKAHLDVFNIGFDDAKNGLKGYSYKFVEGDRTKMVGKSSLDELSERKIEH